jgi:hypothetical protein
LFIKTSTILPNSAKINSEHPSKKSIFKLDINLAQKDAGNSSIKRKEVPSFMHNTPSSSSSLHDYFIK